jgi:hypothetical protein
MRVLPILLGIAVSFAAVWTVTLAAADPQQGAVPGTQRQGGYEGAGGLPQTSRVLSPLGSSSPLRYTRYHTAPMGSGGLILYQVQIQPPLFPGQPGLGPAPPGMPTGGLDLGGPEPAIGTQPVLPAMHILTTAGEPHEAAATPQPDAEGALAAPQAGVAPMQPNPAASPALTLPPGATGPGRRMSGWSGPGRPGPGRPARPRG